MKIIINKHQYPKGATLVAISSMVHSEIVVSHYEYWDCHGAMFYHESVVSDEGLHYSIVSKGKPIWERKEE
jgi:hypothetical protein